MRASNNFRDLLFPLDEPRLVGARTLTARQFGEAVRNVPLPKLLIETWKPLLAEPFHGITCDGHCEQGLFPIEDEGAPVVQAAEAATALLGHLDEPRRKRVCFSIDAVQWRVWSNPEFLVHDYGLRLEDESETTRSLILRLLEVSMGPRGHAKVLDSMRTNAFLGQLTALPNVMNEWSYNFNLFGQPSSTEPWGWNLYGHHLCLNCIFIGNQMVVSPVFMGAEPNLIDKGHIRARGCSRRRKRSAFR